MGDSRRFHLFACFIASQVPAHQRAQVRVADVAAGKGYLSWALREHGFRQITPFEPYPRRGGQVRRLGIRVQEFEPSFAQDFDLLVGMHPDAATDCIFAGAARAGCMAVVCPCCVRPCTWTYWGSKTSHREWHEHLCCRSAEEGLELKIGTLPMAGANVLMWGGALQ